MMARMTSDEAKSDLPTNLGAPATRALAAAGYERLEQFATVSEAELLWLHGMGPKALGRLKQALAAEGLALADADRDVRELVEGRVEGGDRSMTFRATILLGGKTATGIKVPPEIVARLGAGKRPPVRVTINGYAYRSSVATMGGAFMLPVSAEHRQGAGVAAGDELEVEVELDSEPREVTVPPDFGDALDQEADARRTFDGLSYSQKRRYVLSIEEAKSAETRQRRIANAVGELREGRARR